MAEQTKILKLKNADIISVSCFAKKIIKDLRTYSLAARRVNNEYFSPKYLRKLTRERDVKFFVAKSGKRIMGLAYGFKNLPGSFYVCWIMVAKDIRKNKLGSDLLATLIKSAPAKTKKIMADIRVTNRPSVEFFKSNGFKKIGEKEYWHQQYFRYARSNRIWRRKY